MSELAAWDSFYVIVGSAAGALIGLQFVVVTLIAQRPTRAAPEASAAFGTPTIVHFSAALLLSALVRAPWQATAVPVILWAALGLCGAIYSLNVIRRMRKQGVYEPGAIAALSHASEALFGIGAAALLLLFIGIHNAWDAVFYHVFFSKRGTDEDRR